MEPWPAQTGRGHRGRTAGRSPASTRCASFEQYESALSPQERNALLRREGIYSAYLTESRRERDRAESEPAPERKPGRPGKSAAEAENERLRKENEKLAAKLSKTEAALEIMGKVRSWILLRIAADGEYAALVSSLAAIHAGRPASWRFAVLRLLAGARPGVF